MKFFEAVANIFRIPDLRKRILFTLMMLAIYRLGGHIPTPGIDANRLAAYFAQNQGSLFGFIDLFSGGMFRRLTIFALGIMPYITASIILQLLTVVVPTLEKLQKEGELGRRKITQWTRYLTVILAVMQSFGIALTLEKSEGGFVLNPGFGFMLMTMLSLTTGTAFIMWLGEQITERGIGNGVSLVITIGILARLPQAIVALKDMFHPGGGAEAHFNLGHGVALILLLAGVIAGVIAITQAQRKVPVQYAQRAVGRKVYSGGTSFMPLRVNYSGVMPIIFAQAILMFPQKFFQLVHGTLSNNHNPGAVFISNFSGRLSNLLAERSYFYLLVYALMILFFSYFWVATQFNELQIADDLKKNGGYIPGVRPGQATSDYLHNAMSRITLAGAVFLTVIAVIPLLLYNQLQIPYAVATFFGGTSMLILVGVLLDTMRQMETHLLMRHYDGFLKKGRLKGRF